MAVNENVPLYFRMYYKLKHSIISGEFEKGAKLGIISELAKKYNVGQESIRRALYLLEMEGLLIKKQGLGAIIPENANTTPLEMAKLISPKIVKKTFLSAAVSIYSAEWIDADYRLTQLYGLQQGPPVPKIYKIFFRIGFKHTKGLDGIMTHYFSESLYRALKLKKSAKPYNVLLKVCDWMDDTLLKLTETLRPHLCLDETANLLGMPDGTPVFYQEFFMRNTTGLCHYFHFISTANIQSTEIDLC
ncbi:MAG: GntR family transcriptional regulator [Syntrophobacteraceae bacterium]